MNTSPLDQFYLLDGEERRGPYTLAQMQHMWRNKTIFASMTYWREGMEDWRPLIDLVDTLEPPRQPRAVSAPVRRASSASTERGTLVPIYVISFLFPLVGELTGAIWAAKPETKERGMRLLTFALVVDVAKVVLFVLLSH